MKHTRATIILSPSDWNVEYNNDGVIIRAMITHSRYNIYYADVGA